VPYTELWENEPVLECNLKSGVANMQNAMERQSLHLRKATALFALVLFGMVGAASAQADILFSSLPFLAGGPGSAASVAGPSFSNGATGGYSELAEQFTPSVTANLDSIQVPFVHSSGVNNAVTITLFSNVNNLPGVVLASQDIPASTLTSSRVLYTLNFGGSPLLTAGTPYWVDAATTGDTSDGWADTSTSTTGIGAKKNGFGGSFTSHGLDSLAFQVNGTATATTPEPGALAFFVASGLSGVGFLLRGRRRA
jgi:hypothetical protein